MKIIEINFRRVLPSILGTFVINCDESLARGKFKNISFCLALGRQGLSEEVGAIGNSRSIRETVFPRHDSRPFFDRDNAESNSASKVLYVAAQTARENSIL